jgi:hypothetical protein
VGAPRAKAGFTAWAEASSAAPRSTLAARAEAAAAARGAAAGAALAAAEALGWVWPELSFGPLAEGSIKSSGCVSVMQLVTSVNGH